MKVFELKATHGKGLNHKAMVMDHGNGVYSLISYGTEVAAGVMAAKGKPAMLYRLVDGFLVRKPNGDEAWVDYSATTGRHLVAFAEFLGVKYGGKADWDKMDVVTLADVKAA